MNWAKLFYTLHMIGLLTLAVMLMISGDFTQMWAVLIYVKLNEVYPWWKEEY